MSAYRHTVIVLPELPVAAAQKQRIQSAVEGEANELEGYGVSSPCSDYIGGRVGRPSTADLRRTRDICRRYLGDNAIAGH